MNLRLLNWSERARLLLGLALFLFTTTLAQAQTITGTVKSDDGQGLVGVSIIVKGETFGTLSGTDGEFSINVPDAGTNVLVFSFFGFQEQEVALGGRTNVSVTLATGTILDEVVVTGYATQKRTEVTGAIASVNADQFNVGVITSPEQLLQAKVPGVRITSASGEPGATVDVTIRGAGSLRAGNSPLYVVDGVALNNDPITPGSSNISGAAVATVAGPKNPLNFLNPDDIESIDVLKDASATAIYGSRGSNGVILITTKKGASGSGNLSYNGYIGTSSLAGKIDLVSTGGGTDWQDEITRTAIAHNHNLAYSGGSDKAFYRASLSLLDQEGIVRKSELQRYTGRFNSSVFALNNKLRLDLNLIASHVVDNGIPRSDISDTSGELITGALGADPTRPVRNPDGTYSSGPANPVEYSDVWNDITRTDRILANTSLSYTIIDGLKYQLNLGIDRSSAMREQELGPNTLEGPNFANGSYGFSSLDATNVLVENFLTYDTGFGDNRINILVGHAYQQFDANGFNASLINYIVPSISGLDDPGNATANAPAPLGGNNPDGFRERNKLESVFARVNYNFDNTFLVSASMRADGSSKFGANNRWGYFPAVSAAWNLSNSMDTGFFDELKARVGWGQTGNQEIPNKATQETFQATQNGISRVREANPDLKWEVSSQFNVGIDFVLADNKLYGAIDYFNRVNTDPLLLVDSEPPAVSQKWINLPGEINNQGVEFSLGSQIVNSKAFNWTLDANATFSSNEVSFPDGREILTGVLSGRSINGTQVQLIADGLEIGTFFVPTDNGDGTSTEAQVQGSAVPNVVYGLSSYMNFSNLDFSFNISGVAGNQIYNATDNFLANFGGNVSTRVADAGQLPPGASSFFLEDGGFLRLNNATLGYTFPDGSISFLSNARIYVTGQNLFVITDYTGYDPEVNTPTGTGGNLSYGIDFAAYPRARTFLFGVNIDFN